MLDTLKSIFTFVAVFEILVGIYFLLIGFKVINKFKNNKELEIKWYSKYKTTFIIGGIFLIIMGCLSLPFFKII